MKKKTSPKPSVLTPADLSALVNTMKVVFPTREDVETIVEKKLDAKIKNIPTKNDFFTRMDMLTKEIKDAREELAAHSVSHDRFTPPPSPAKSCGAGSRSARQLTACQKN